MKWFTLILSVIIIAISAILCVQLISNSISNQSNKSDYAEINDIKYGLFSVEVWKQQITLILSDEIDKLNFSQTDERDLRKHIEALLGNIIDKVANKIKEKNAGSLEGWLKQSIINFTVDLKDIKSGIPEYTDAVIHELKKSNTKIQIKTILKKQLEQYFNKTFDFQDTNSIKRILLRTHSKDIESAKIALNEAVKSKHQLIMTESTALIILSALLFALSGFSKQPMGSSQYLLLVSSLIMLLTAGVTTPMIDMEARISQLRFVLLGHSIHFENQILYFQSKSILDVFWIMITHSQIQMKLVGILLVTFSVFFPALKILSTMAYYYNYHHARENSIIKFFVLKSGKWSMSDVMVIAIFMAFIGFNGIITSQLDSLNSASPELVILTTNATALQPGYYLFLTYTLLALVLSGFLTKEPTSTR